MTPETASQLIDQRINDLGDWRGKTLARVRRVITRADPAIVEEWKWDVPVWSRDGIICTGESYKDKIKLTFQKGASLDDPRGLFNASLDGNARRAIDLFEGDQLDGDAFKALVLAAVAANGAPGIHRSPRPGAARSWTALPGVPQALERAEPGTQRGARGRARHARRDVTAQR